jgi:YVTN family beta-propeller protein
VPNEGSGTLGVIDLASDAVVAEIAVGDKPRGTAVDAAGRHAWVAVQPGSVAVVDLAARRVVKMIAVGRSPEGLSLSPDGRWLAVDVTWNDSSNPNRYLMIDDSEFTDNATRIQDKDWMSDLVLTQYATS